MIIRPIPLNITIDESNYEDFVESSPVVYEREEGYNPVKVSVDIDELIPNNVSRVDIPCSAYALEHEQVFTVNELTNLLYDTASSIKLLRRYGVVHPSWDDHLSLILTTNDTFTFTPGEYYAIVDGVRVRADYFSGITVKTEVIPIRTAYIEETNITSNGQTIISIPSGTYPSSVAVNVQVPVPSTLEEYTYPNAITTFGNKTITVPNNQYAKSVKFNINPPITLLNTYNSASTITSNGLKTVNLPEIEGNQWYTKQFTFNVNVPSPNIVSSYREYDIFTENVYGNYSAYIELPADTYTNKVYFQIHVPDEVPEVDEIAVDDGNTLLNVYVSGMNTRAADVPINFSNEDSTKPQWYNKTFLYVELWKDSYTNLNIIHVVYMDEPMTIWSRPDSNKYYMFDITNMTKADIIAKCYDSVGNLLIEKDYNLVRYPDLYDKMFMGTDQVLTW